MVTTTTKKRRDFKDMQEGYLATWAEKGYKGIESSIEKERTQERRSYLIMEMRKHFVIWFPLIQPWIDEWIKFEYEKLFTFQFIEIPLSLKGGKWNV